MPRAEEVRIARVPNDELVLLALGIVVGSGGRPTEGGI